MENLELSIPHLYLNRPGQLILEELVTGRESLSVDGIEQDPPASPLWKNSYNMEDIKYGVDGLIKHGYIEKGLDDKLKATDAGRYYLRRRVDCYFKKNNRFSKLPRDLQQAAVRLYIISSGQMTSEDDVLESAEVLERNGMLTLVSIVGSEILASVTPAMESKKIHSKEFKKELEERRPELKEIRDKAIADLCARHCVPYEEFVKLKNFGGNTDKGTFDRVVKGYLSYVLVRVDETLKVPT